MMFWSELIQVRKSYNNELTYFDVVVVVIYISILSFSTSRCILVFLTNKVVNLNIALSDLFLLDIVFLVFALPFLFVSVFVVNTVIKVLIV